MGKHSAIASAILKHSNREPMSQASPSHDPHELAQEIMAHHHRRMLAEGGMVEEDINQVVPQPGQQEFLSSENDDSHMLHNNEEFLSADEHKGNETKRPNIPDTDPKPIIETILDKMRLKKSRNMR